MALVAVADHRLSIISLVDHRGASSLLQSLLGPLAADEVRIPVRADTVAQRNLLGSRLDEAVRLAERAPLIVAEGVGCLAAAWWARLSPHAYVSRVAGAVLVGPDEDDRLADRLAQPFASPRLALPFPSVVVTACAAGHAHLDALALEWGSQLEAPDASATPLRRVQSILERLTAAVVERDVRAGQALMAARRG